MRAPTGAGPDTDAVAGDALAAALGDGETAAPSTDPLDTSGSTLVVAMGAGTAAAHDAKRMPNAIGNNRRTPKACAGAASASSELSTRNCYERRASISCTS